MRKRMAPCLAGLVLLTSCSLATMNPMAAPAGRPEAAVAADEAACAEAASPSAGHYATGAAITTAGIVVGVLTGTTFFYYSIRSDAGYVACKTANGYTNPATNPMPDGTPAPGL